MTTLILALTLHRMRLRRTLARWWEWLAGPKITFATDEELLVWAASLSQFHDDRGHCSVCGVDHALTRSGHVWKHGPCPGGGELPAQMLMEMTT